MCSSELIRRAVADLEAPTEAGRTADRSAPLRRPELLEGLSRVQDLTHTLVPDFPVFPAYRPFEARPLARVEEDGYAASELRFVEHTGTHLDAPSHFFADGASAEHLPVAALIAPLVVISLVERAALDPDAALAADEVLAWEGRHGRIPDGAVVAIHTGWEERIPHPGRFLNLDEAGVMHFPGFGRDAAELLVHERRVAGAATDTLSLDIGAAPVYEAHRVILGAGCYGLENVARLGTVPPTGAVLVVGAPKHAGATGGPARLLALY